MIRFKHNFNDLISTKYLKGTWKKFSREQCVCGKNYNIEYMIYEEV